MTEFYNSKVTQSRYRNLDTDVSQTEIDVSLDKLDISSSEIKLALRNKINEFSCTFLKYLFNEQQEQNLHLLDDCVLQIFIDLDIK